MKMQRELAEHICDLINELRDIESMRHGIYKAMLPKDIVEQRVHEYDQQIEKIKNEIEIL